MEILTKLDHKFRLFQKLLGPTGTRFAMASLGTNVTQLVLEFHHRFHGFNLFQTEDAVKSLNRQGYLIFHISDGKEYPFIRP